MIRTATLSCFALALFVCNAVQGQTQPPAQAPSFSIPFPGDGNVVSPEIEAGIEQAKERVFLANQQYETDVRLHQRGSKSRNEVSKSLYQLKIARLRLKALQNASMNITESEKADVQSEIALELAKVSTQFAKSEYETAKRLHAKGSQTNQELRRTLFNYKLSRIDLKRATLENESKPVDEKADRLEQLGVEEAKVRHEMAQSDYEVVKRLYQRGGISKLRLEYATYLENVAKLEWLAARVNAAPLSDTDKGFKHADISVAKVKAKLKYLKSVYTTKKSLHDRGRVPKLELLRALEGVKKAELELKAAQAAAVSEVET